MLGDFSLICRFGGEALDGNSTSSAIIFKYQNNTGLSTVNCLYWTQFHFSFCFRVD